MTELEETLAGKGHKAEDFDAPTLYSKPYRAQFLSRLAGGLAGGGASPRVVCETGFGAGHSALFWIALSVGPGAVLPHPIAVHSFDHGLAKYSIPAHDFVDERWPENLYLYLGECGDASQPVSRAKRCDARFTDALLVWTTSQCRILPSFWHRLHPPCHCRRQLRDGSADG